MWLVLYLGVIEQINETVDAEHVVTGGRVFFEWAGGAKEDFDRSGGKSKIQFQLVVEVVSVIVYIHVGPADDVILMFY